MILKIFLTMKHRWLCPQKLKKNYKNIGPIYSPDELDRIWKVWKPDIGKYHLMFLIENCKFWLVKEIE